MLVYSRRKYHCPGCCSTSCNTNHKPYEEPEPTLNPNDDTGDEYEDDYIIENEDDNDIAGMFHKTPPNNRVISHGDYFLQRRVRVKRAMKSL